MRSDVVLDTHALLWWASDRRRLGPHSAARIEAADRVLVSAISFWEIGMLASKGRIELDRSVADWRRDVLATGPIDEIPIDGRIAVDAAALEDFHGDPADRLIVASVALGRSTLVSKDRRIAEWAARTGAITAVW